VLARKGALTILLGPGALRGGLEVEPCQAAELVAGGLGPGQRLTFVSPARAPAIFESKFESKLRARPAEVLAIQLFPGVFYLLYRNSLDNRFTEMFGKRRPDR
jgi:hypothetical protein